MFVVVSRGEDYDTCLFVCGREKRSRNGKRDSHTERKKKNIVFPFDAK